MIRTQLPVYYVHLAKTKPSAKACRVPKAVKAKKKIQHILMHFMGPLCLCSTVLTV